LFTNHPQPPKRQREEEVSMSTQELPIAKSRIDEPDPSKPERRKKKRPSTGRETPEPRPRREEPSPELPHNPQDIPEQELHAD
jgi:hypothetical protein